MITTPFEDGQPFIITSTIEFISNLIISLQGNHKGYCPALALLVVRQLIIKGR